MMKRFLLPDGADTLLAFVEATARELTEKHEELGNHLEVEARLRAVIAAATFAIRRYRRSFGREEVTSGDELHAAGKPLTLNPMSRDVGQRKEKQCQLQ